MEGAPRSLPLAARTSGPMFAQALAYAAMAIGLALTGLIFLASVPSHRPGPCEAGRVGGAALAMTLLCAGVLIGRPALYDVVAAIRGRRGGSVTLTASTFELDVPGLLRQPWTLERAWIDEVRLADGSGRGDVRPVSGGRHGDLKFSVRRPCAVLVFNRVLQLGQAAAYVPRMLQRFAPVQPSPWTCLGLLAVQPDDPAAFVNEVDAWLRSETPTASAPSPPQVTHSYRRLVLLLFPLVLGVGAFGVFSLSLPGGC